MTAPTSPNDPPAHRPQGSGMTNDNDLRTALTKLADGLTCQFGAARYVGAEIRALLAACLRGATRG